MQCCVYKYILVLLETSWPDSEIFYTVDKVRYSSRWQRRPETERESSGETVESDKGDGPAPQVLAGAGEIHSLHGESDDLFCSE